MFGAILVARPRQVGKTTMLDQLTKGLCRATLGDPIMRVAAGSGLAVYPLNAA